MNKLSTLFAIATLATTLGLAGCKNKAKDSSQQPAAEKTNEAAPAATTPATPDQAKPADQAAPAGSAAPATAPAAGSAAAPAAAANADLPKECADYKADIDKLSTCDKLPATTRDSLKQAYTNFEQSLANMTAEQKQSLAASCKTGAEAVEQSAKKTCGW